MLNSHAPCQSRIQSAQGSSGAYPSKVLESRTHAPRRLPSQYHRTLDILLLLLLQQTVIIVRYLTPILFHDSHATQPRHSVPPNPTTSRPTTPPGPNKHLAPIPNPPRTDRASLCKKDAPSLTVSCPDSCTRIDRPAELTTFVLRPELLPRPTRLTSPCGVPKGA